MRFLLLVWGCLVLASHQVQGQTGDKPLDIGKRLELFVDEFLIDKLAGSATRKLHQPVPQEVVLTFDRPWEGNTCAYFTVFRDGDLYRMYYRGSQHDDKKRARPEVSCYAESKDGIHWTRPNLGLFDFQGSKENNIVWTGTGAHNFTPFKDDNPKAAADARYKALAGGGGGLLALKSADGIRWTPMSPKPVITKGSFDSQNLAFWDAGLGKYRDYHRTTKGGVRDITTCLSEDFLTWTDPVFLEYPGAEKEQLYTNTIRPYERAPHIFIGFPARFKSATQQVEPIFMSSRDGLTFHRWSEPVIPITAPKDRDGNRSNYMAWGMVQLPGKDRELSVYATEAYYGDQPGRLRRFSYRLDGFVSVHAEGEGELRTRPLKFQGEKLEVNFVAAGKGNIGVEIQDLEGKALEGFSLKDCQPLAGDTVGQAVSWKGGSLNPLAGRPVRLRFVLRDADLFSFRFQ